MGNKKQKLSKVKKNRGNISSLLNWQTHRQQKTDKTESLTIPIEDQNNEINTDDVEMGCNILSPSTSNINHNILDSKYKLLVTNTNENKQVHIVLDSERTQIFTKSVENSKICKYNCEGRRFVDIKHFFNSLKNIKHDPLSCTFQNLNLINERKNGFFLEFIFKCDFCNKIDVISNEPKTTDISLSINTAIVMATINSGQGFAQLDTMAAFLNMPSMSNMTYQKLHLDISNHTNDTAIEAMILAGNEEAEIAKKEDYLIFSLSLLYFLLSQQASIIGYNTKKVLYMGVRNKYCSICDKAKLNGNAASAHVCFKNWDGTSTAMEADIIVEGFRQSIPIHSVIYNKLIGDGDSSVTKKLFMAKPYGRDVFVTKIECMNYSLRNYLNRIVDLSVHRKSSSGTVVPGVLRKVLKDK
ncbi:hypothetical protein AGLY_015113 [Aphis glycines]|uniref:Mutator-like transposase domain-containing protein n=1 Tax=Aphis glycines TaxID=307491 RepID=A0A6G0T2F0_APHGL|nr:hypothetical protein AGLY_015113 [Aphis glycines]